MKKVMLAALATVALAGSAAAQPNHEQPYEFILAKLAAAEGRFPEALSLMDKVVAGDPANPVVLFERAAIFADAGRLDAAEMELRKVTASHPDFFDAQRLLGRMLLDRAGNDRAKVDDALGHLRAAFKLNPDDLQTGMAVSQILSSTGHPEDAEKVLAQMLERVPDQRSVNYNYAQVLTKLGRGDESRQYLEKAVQLDPTFGPAILQLVDIYQKQNEWARAAELLQPLISEDPINLDLQRQQAIFFLRAGMAEKARTAFKAIAAADPKDDRARFYLAEALSDLEQFDEAQKIYRTLLEKTPNDPDLLTSYGLSLIAQKKYDEAAKNFRTLLTIKDVPENLSALAHTQLAFIELQKGSYDTALTMVQPYLIFSGTPNTQAINIALDALRKQKKYAEAITLLQPLVQKFGSDPFLNARYTEMLVRAGESRKASELAQEQLKLGTKNAIGTAEAFIQAGDFKSALALIKQAMITKPDELDLQFALGSAYERSGDTAGAEKAFLAILDKHADHAPTLNYLGYMWAEKGVNLGRAAEMLQKAVAAEPRNGAYVDSLGWAYYQQGRLDLAEKYLKDATELLPRDSTVHEHLGDVLAKRGDLVRALSMYRVALKLEPEAKDEEKLRTKIVTLERQTQAAQR